jgi:hypothetical protein
MDSSVQRMLDLSASMDEQLARLFERPRRAGNPRALVTIALCDVALEHGRAQRILIEAGCQTTAMAMVRLQFEAVVRAIWLHHGATEEWVERFCAPMEPGQLAEPALGPSVDAMLATISQTAPAFVGRMLVDLKAASWQPMNSYVHGGIRPVVQTLAGCTPPHLIGILRNANGLALMAGNVFVMACGDAELAGRIREVQLASMECLSPVRGA